MAWATVSHFQRGRSEFSLMLAVAVVPCMLVTHIPILALRSCLSPPKGWLSQPLSICGQNYETWLTTCPAEKVKLAPPKEIKKSNSTKSCAKLHPVHFFLCCYKHFLPSCCRLARFILDVGLVDQHKAGGGLRGCWQRPCWNLDNWIHHQYDVGCSELGEKPNGNFPWRILKQNRWIGSFCG